MRKMRIGFLHSLIRREEKLLLQAFEHHPGVEIVMLDDRKLIFGRGQVPQVDAVFERSLSHSRSEYALRLLESSGIPCINRADVAMVCGDKIRTSAALDQHAVAQPRWRVALSDQSAIEAIEELGYPAVMKPAVGSWGRLLSKINDREAAEAVIEHKLTLGSYQHSTFYIQEYVEKGGRDIRSFVVGDECICAIYRKASHWITNTARGASAANCPVDDDIRRISLAAAEAVGGGVLAVDLFEGPTGYLVNEVNYTMEFRNSIEPTGVDIPDAMVRYVMQCAEQGLSA